MNNERSFTVAIHVALRRIGEALRGAVEKLQRFVVVILLREPRGERRRVVERQRVERRLHLSAERLLREASLRIVVQQMHADRRSPRSRPSRRLEVRREIDELAFAQLIELHRCDLPIRVVGRCRVARLRVERRQAKACDARGRRLRRWR